MERHAERGFAGACGPAGEDVFDGVVACCLVAFQEFDLMGADAYLSYRLGDFLRDAQLASPVGGFDFVCGDAAGWAEIFAAG